jgi:hypothetical protein
MKILQENQKRTIEEINSLIDLTNSKLDKEINGEFDIDKYKVLQKKLVVLKDQKRVFNLTKKLERLNNDQKAKRDLLKEFLNISLPKHEDITNLDSSIHLTKIKKHPILKAFFEKYNVRELVYSFKAKKYTSFRSRDLGTFEITQYGRYASETSQYLNFESILKQNSIRAKNLTTNQFLASEKKLIASSKKITDAIKKHNDSLTDLQAYKFEREELINFSYQEKANVINSKKFF